MVVKAALELDDTASGMYRLACYCALTKEPKEAIRFLHRSLDLGYANELIGDDPDLAILRGDPEFASIVAEAKRRIAED